MSMGSKVTPVRIEASLIAEIEAAIERANPMRDDEPYRMSSWIRKAITEKLAHLKRKPRRKLKLNAQGRYPLPMRKESK